MFLADIWPSLEEIREVIASAIDPELFRRTYAVVFEGDDRWRALPIPAGDRYAWDPRVDVHRQAAVLRGPHVRARAGRRHRGRPRAGGARRLGHDRPHLAGRLDRPVVARPASGCRSAASDRCEFNSYGARRGHHEVMMRGTFGNIRLRNRLVEGKEGPYTVHLPSGEEAFIYDAAMRYAAEGVPLVLLAGREYGSGSSRDWAAKGTALLGRPRRHRRELRADPPLEPRRHGRPAAPVHAGRLGVVARA